MQKIYRGISGISKTPEIFALNTNIELDLHKISYSTVRIEDEKIFRDEFSG